jgi:hypothetical protein
MKLARSVIFRILAKFAPMDAGSVCGARFEQSIEFETCAAAALMQLMLQSTREGNTERVAGLAGKITVVAC